MTNLNTSPEIEEAMKCPVCYEFLHPPINLCKNGHAFCNDCHTTLEKQLDVLFPSCPICRGDQFWPSHLLDIIYDQKIVTCKNQSYGCQLVCYGSEMRKHLKNCEFEVTKCPRQDGGCAWKGPRAFLTKHYVENHVQH